jgi:hypothetical protein
VVYSDKHGGSAGAEGVFGGGAGFTGLGIARFAAEAGLLAGEALPVVKYLRIFSSRLAPMPRIANKSSTLLNAPYDLRICKILSAVAGPIPGTNCNSSEVAVFKLIGAGGGFFLAARRHGTTHNVHSTRQIRAKDRQAIAAK